MATYYNLPVYKQSYDLLLEIFQLTKEFTAPTQAKTESAISRVPERI